MNDLEFKVNTCGHSLEAHMYDETYDSHPDCYDCKGDCDCIIVFTV